MLIDRNPEPHILDYTATRVISCIKMPHELYIGTSVRVRFLRKMLCKNIYREDSDLNLRILYLQIEKYSCNRK
jgi:hypothetical protein